jgi:hypothetical protein
VVGDFPPIELVNFSLNYSTALLFLAPAMLHHADNTTSIARLTTTLSSQHRKADSATPRSACFTFLRRAFSRPDFVSS